MYKLVKTTLMASFAAFYTSIVAAQPLTNADILDLVAAGMDDDTIIAMIQTSESDFDSSTKAIISLSKAGVGQSVIKALVEANAAPASQTDVAANEDPNEDKFDPEQLMRVDGDTRTPMRYVTPQMRTAARAMGFGGVATYAVMRGSESNTRIISKKPIFELAIPSNAQPNSYVTLASFAKRKNGSREVLVGGGYMSYSTGITPDRIIDTTVTRLDDQSRAPEDFTLYHIEPKADLKQGEYAVIFYNSQIPLGGYFTAGLDSYFDFGID